MQVKHTSDIADKLEELAVAIRAMDEEIPGTSRSLTVDITMHRSQGDGTTNAKAMAFVDRYAAVVGIPADQIGADGNSYGTHSVHGLQVILFPLRSTPIPPKFDPNI